MEKFAFARIPEMDGGVIGEAWGQALRRCQDDCDDRPAVDEPRKIVLTMTMTPVPKEDGSLDSCAVEFTITDSLPKRRSKTYDMVARRGARGGLFYNELSPDHGAQGTLDDVDPGLRVREKEGSADVG